MTTKLRFKLTIEGCKEAQEYLRHTGAWNLLVERMDGYSQVIYANELYNATKPKKNDTKLN